MSRTVRLEGLSVAVNAQDLRLHFSGLKIPQGGITIIGGERGLAFLSFTKWEDARRAIEFSGCHIKDSIVRVSPSSTSEMEWSLIKYEAPFFSRNGVREDRDRRGSSSSRTCVYLRITVTVGVTTTTSIRRYFTGLHIADILPIKDDRALRNGALVKFSNSADANEGMRRYRDSMDVNVTWSSEREWVKYGGRVYYDEDSHSSSSRHDRIRHHSRSPERHSRSSYRRSRSPRWHSRSPERYSRPRQDYSRSPQWHSRSPERYSRHRQDYSRSPQWHSRSPERYSRPRHGYTRSPRWHSRSPLSGSRSPRLHSRSPHVRSRSPRRHARSPQNVSNEHDPIYDADFHVHVTNLRYSTKKEDLRKWFFNLVSNDNIKFLYDERGRKTRECFVGFKNEKDYRKVLRLDKVTFEGRLLFITSISKSSMTNLLTGRKALFSRHHTKGNCLYLRNFPSDVTKSDIQKFFAGFSLNEEDISLLCDRQGHGLGEAMISLSSDKELDRAEKLHRKKYKDKEILLRRIPEDKLQSFLCANSVSLLPEDPYDCVTQEDDLLDEDSNQEKNIPGEDDNLTDEDSSFHQTDNTHECVSQEDDVTDVSAVHEEDAPDDSAVHEEEVPDDSAVHVEEAPDDSAVHVEEAPDDSAVHVEEAPDSAAHVEEALEDSAVHVEEAPESVEEAPDDSAVHVEEASDDSAVHVVDAPSTQCSSAENTNVDSAKAIPKGATPNDDGLWANVFV